MAQRKKFQELDLSNSFLFAVALEDEEICQLMLRLILGIEIPRVHVKTENSILFSSDYRFIRLDLYASDEAQVEYNLEMQNENEGNLPKRSRFHQAHMDVSALKPGEDFNKLSPSYVIFICTFDPFGKGAYRYIFEEWCKEEEIPLGDETKKIFLNTRGRKTEGVPEELIHLLHYIENTTEEYAEKVPEPEIKQIQKKVARLKKSREVEEKYMTVDDLIKSAEKKAEAKGLAEGKAEGLAEGKAKGLAEGKAKGLAEGKAKGLAEGLVEGSKRMLQLVAVLMEEGHMEEIASLKDHPERVEELCKKYHI